MGVGLPGAAGYRGGPYGLRNSSSYFLKREWSVLPLCLSLTCAADLPELGRSSFGALLRFLVLGLVSVSHSSV